MTIQIYFGGIIWTISSATRIWDLASVQMNRKTHILKYKKNNWGMQSKMVFKICEGIWCSSFYVKEFDVIVHKKNISLYMYNHIKFLPFCTPHHYRTWWLRWELGKVTRSYWNDRLINLRIYFNHIATSYVTPRTYLFTFIYVTPVHFSITFEHYLLYSNISCLRDKCLWISLTEIWCALHWGEWTWGGTT